MDRVLIGSIYYMAVKFKSGAEANFPTIEDDSLLPLMISLMQIKLN